MEIKTNKEFLIVDSIRGDLEYLFERLKGEQQDYLDLDILMNAIKSTKNDLRVFTEKQKKECPDLKVGAMIRISGGDGISYTRRDYYYITKITSVHLIADRIISELGDYGRKLELERECKVPIESFIMDYNKNYHKIVDKSEWDELLRYIEKLPWRDK